MNGFLDALELLAAAFILGVIVGVGIGLVAFG